jgi:hypothetical protein
MICTDCKYFANYGESLRHLLRPPEHHRAAAEFGRAKQLSYPIRSLHFYEADLISSPDSPFVRDASNKLVRGSYWLDMDDRTLLLVMTKGIGALI